MKHISFFFCIFALILSKIIWEKKSKFGDIKNEEKNDFNNDNNGESQNYGKIDKLYSDLFYEFLQTFCSLPFIILIMKTEDKITKKMTEKLDRKEIFDGMETTKLTEINTISKSNKHNSVDDMKCKKEFINEYGNVEKNESENETANNNKNKNEIEKNYSKYYKDIGLLPKSQFYYFTFLLFYMSRISLILYWNLDKNSQIKFTIFPQMINLFPFFSPTNRLKWHLILPNIIIFNCLLTLLTITIIYLNQTFTSKFTKKVDNKKIEEDKKVNIIIGNNYFLNYLLQERLDLFLLFILFCHFSNFYILSLGSRSAPILSISLLIFLSIATSFVLAYLSYDDSSSDNDGNKNENDDKINDIKNNYNISNSNKDIKVKNNNNNNKINNIKYSITSTLKNKNKLEKNLLLAAFVLHIGMFSRMLFFISGHNFDFGSLQVRNFYFVIFQPFLFSHVVC